MSLFALTLWRPWAWAICHAGKRIENRDWPPPQRIIGARIAIHAGKRLDDEAMAGFGPHAVPPDGGPQGIVAIVRVVGVVSLETCPAEQRQWYAGRYGWLLDSVSVLPEPVPCRGKQGLWPIPDDLLRGSSGQ